MNIILLPIFCAVACGIVAGADLAGHHWLKATLMIAYSVFWGAGARYRAETESLMAQISLMEDLKHE